MLMRMLRKDSSKKSRRSAATAATVDDDADLEPHAAVGEGTNGGAADNSMEAVRDPMER
jgi:hypothetical protein